MRSLKRTSVKLFFIGIGMALPYQVLSTFPQLAARMPRTGPCTVSRGRRARSASAS